MASKHARLDRYISQTLTINRRDVKPMLAQGRILIDGKTATDVDQRIGPFSHVRVDQKTLQNNQPVYIMLNKPKGVVSATKDKQHTTVIDLLNEKNTQNLHIVGRLDLNTSGLMLLTNDGTWSKALTSPVNKITKRYIVTLKNQIDESYIQAFNDGMFFSYEGITTQPANLKIISEHTAEVTLTEGRYHQIKRMFGQFQNPVTALHRLSIGGITLDTTLKAGESRALNAKERKLHHSTFPVTAQ